MPSLFAKVKAKMDLYAHEKVRSLLDGQYGSVFKGRSLDFDDLREYIPGDDVKDIDWKATARSSGIRIRRYQAIIKHLKYGWMTFLQILSKEYLFEKYPL